MDRYVVAHRRRSNGDFLTGADGWQYQVYQDYGRWRVRFQPHATTRPAPWKPGGEFPDKASAFAFVREQVTAHSLGSVQTEAPATERQGGMEQYANVWEREADAPYGTSVTRITVISQRKARATGTGVITGHSEDEALRWFTVCQEHNAEGSVGYARWETRTEAKQASRNPAGWCAGCQEGEAK